jgi:4-hydroxy-tetrahydrodipicolinate synthase
VGRKSAIKMSQSAPLQNSDELKNTLHGGLIPATPVPFDKEGKLHLRAHDSYVDYLSSQNIAGVAVWAHTGRGLMLDAVTARRVIHDWRRALPTKVVIAGVGAKAENSTPQHATSLTVSMAETAAELGADALLVYPPAWLLEHQRVDQQIVEHHIRVAQIGIPLILFYLYEAAGGIGYSESVLDELLSLPNVVGIKVATLDSVMTYQDIAELVRKKHPDKLLITGEDRFLGYSLRRGAQTALIGMGAVCSELQSELLSAHVDGNAERFLELSDAIDKLAEVLFVRPMEGYIKRILCALAHLGMIPNEAAYDPWGPELTPGEVDRIGEVVNSLTTYARAC